MNPGGLRDMHTLRLRALRGWPSALPQPRYSLPAASNCTWLCGLPNRNRRLLAPRKPRTTTPISRLRDPWLAMGEPILLGRAAAWPNNCHSKHCSAADRARPLLHERAIVLTAQLTARRGCRPEDLWGRREAQAAGQSLRLRAGAGARCNCGCARPVRLPAVCSRPPTTTGRASGRWDGAAACTQLKPPAPAPGQASRSCC